MPASTSNGLLPVGTSLHFAGLEQPLRILRALGGGTQGQVYAVASGPEELALKWYLPSCIARDPRLRQRLQQSIRLGPPNGDFLWPMALLEPSEQSRPLIRAQEPGFGYLMPLRPAGYQGAHLHAGGRLEISLQNVLRACFFLADAFHELHLKGLCYKDISLGNLFLRSSDGSILICDNDNVEVDGQSTGASAGSVLGTPGFMAPEVLLGASKPSASSDQFSLAVLLFRLLTRHDPFRGRMELSIRCLDEPARRRLYGEDALFIFDPADPRNRPDPGEHPAALLTWPIYPAALQGLFVQCFGAGLREPPLRPLTGQWKQVLSRCLDQRHTCMHCGEELFHDGPCWSCGQTNAPPLQLQLPHGRVAASAGNQLHRHHFDPHLGETLQQPIASLVSHPSDASILGLRNLSHSSWHGQLRNGQPITVEPGKTCNIAALQQLNTEAGPITTLRG